MKRLLILFLTIMTIFLHACMTDSATQTTETEPTTTSSALSVSSTTPSTTTTTSTTTLQTTTTNLCKATNYEYDLNQLVYDLVWFDEFNSATATQPSIIKWRYQTGGGGWGNNELQYYTDPSLNSNHTNARVGDGHLYITAKRETIGTNEFTSARMNSNVNWLYGKIEVRALLPSGAGTWPAIWMMPKDSAYGNWPNSGEIDIMEHVGTSLNRVHFSIHSERYNHKIGTQKTFVTTIPNVSSEFHLYQVEWLPDQIRFSVDNVLYYTYRPTDFVACPTSKEWPFDRPFHLILNVAMGGWGGTPSASFTEASMIIDYVRVYQSSFITNLTKTN